MLPDDGNYEPGESLVFVTEILKLRSSHKTLLELQTQGEFKGEATPNAVKLRRFFVLAFLVSCYTDTTLQATTLDIAKMLLSRITRLANHLANSSDAEFNAQSYCNALQISMLCDTEYLLEDHKIENFREHVLQFGIAQVQNFIGALLGKFVDTPKKKMFLVVFMYTQTGCVTETAMLKKIVEWSFMQVSGRTVQDASFFTSLYSGLEDFASNSMIKLGCLKAIQLVGNMSGPYGKILEFLLRVVVCCGSTYVSSTTFPSHFSWATVACNLVTAACLTQEQPFMIWFSSFILAVRVGTDLWKQSQTRTVEQIIVHTPNLAREPTTAFGIMAQSGHPVTTNLQVSIGNQIEEVVGSKRKRSSEGREEIANMQATRAVRRMTTMADVKAKNDSV